MFSFIPTRVSSPGIHQQDHPWGLIAFLIFTFPSSLPPPSPNETWTQSTVVCQIYVDVPIWCQCGGEVNVLCPRPYLRQASVLNPFLTCHGDCEASVGKGVAWVWLYVVLGSEALTYSIGNQRAIKISSPVMDWVYDDVNPPLIQKETTKLWKRP